MAVIYHGFTYITKHLMDLLSLITKPNKDFFLKMYETFIKPLYYETVKRVYGVRVFNPI